MLPGAIIANHLRCSQVPIINAKQLQFSKNRRSDDHFTSAVNILGIGMKTSLAVVADRAAVVQDPIYDDRDDLWSAVYDKRNMLPVSNP